jgi:CheY-like chemotaxis protein
MTAKLLVADDSVTIQKIVGLAFNAEDAVIEAVSSGDAAMDTARIFKPDIVLADVFMPGMGGYEVCESIKNDSELAETPVILLVGTFEPFDESEAARVKCDGHITKPFDTSELIEMVRSLVGDKMMPQNGETPMQSLPEETEPAASAKPPSSFPDAKGLVNPGVWDSYLGSSSVVEMFDPETRAAAHALSLLQAKQDAASDSSPESGNKPESGDEVSENLLDIIVERVMRRMSSDVIREVAWEVVPELSEVLLRRVIEEQNQS